MLIRFDSVAGFTFVKNFLSTHRVSLRKARSSKDHGCQKDSREQGAHVTGYPRGVC